MSKHNKIIYVFFGLVCQMLFSAGVCAQTMFEFPTTQIDMDDNVVVKQNLNVNLNDKRVTATLSVNFLGDTREGMVTKLNSTIGKIFINIEDEIVIEDTQGEIVALVYVSEDSKNGYYVYYDAAKNGHFKVIMTSNETFGPSFFKLRKIADALWSNESGSSSGASSNYSANDAAGVFNLRLQDIVKYPLGLVTSGASGKDEYYSKLKASGLNLTIWNTGTAKIELSKQAVELDGMKFEHGTAAYWDSQATFVLRTGNQKGVAGKKRALETVNKWKQALLSLGCKVVSTDDKMSLTGGRRALPPRPLEIKFKCGNNTITLAVYAESHANDPQSQWEYAVEISGRYPQ